jgi:hypothetical protein
MDELSAVVVYVCVVLLLGCIMVTCGCVGVKAPSEVPLQTQRHQGPGPGHVYEKQS